MPVPRNQARTALIGEIRPGPLHHHNDAITEPDQEQNMNKQPRQPGEKTRNMNLSKLSHGRRTPDRSTRHALSGVEVPSAAGGPGVEGACPRGDVDV